MASGPEYELEARLLDESDVDWVSRFSAGDEWWSREVTSFLTDHALRHTEHGLSTTVLFSFPGSREIIGFAAIAAASVPADRIAHLVDLPADHPVRVPAVLIPYMGVSQDHRGRGLGEEIHVQLLESIGHSWIGARVLYLECWAENEAGARFWQRLGYVPFQTIQQDGPNGEAPLVRMVFDRFAME